MPCPRRPARSAGHAVGDVGLVARLQVAVAVADLLGVDHARKLVRKRLDAGVAEALQLGAAFGDQLVLAAAFGRF